MKYTLAKTRAFHSVLSMAMSIALFGTLLSGAKANTVNQWLFDAPPTNQTGTAPNYLAVNDVAGGTTIAELNQYIAYLNLQVNGGPFYSTVGGQALFLGSAGNYAAQRVANGTNWSGKTAITVEAWVNPSSGVTGTRDVVFDGGNGIRLTSTTGGFYMQGYIYNGSYIGTATGTILIPFDTWTHVAMTYDGATIRAYVGNQLDKSYAITTTLTANTVNTYVGSWQTQNYFKGYIDEVRSSDVALPLGDGSGNGTIAWNGSIASFKNLQAGLYVANATGNTITHYDPTGSASPAPTISPSPITSSLSSPQSIVLDGAGNMLVSNSSNNTIGKYNAATGAVINASFITGLNAPRGLVIDLQGNLYVCNSGSNTIGKYNAATGAVINASLISGLSTPSGIALCKGVLYVSNFGNGRIGKYTTNPAPDNYTSGRPLTCTIKEDFITGLSSPWGLAVDADENLYVCNSGGNSIGKYKGSDGTAINASCISGLNSPREIVLDGGYLYVINNGNNTISRYNNLAGINGTTSATLVNAGYITGTQGLSGPVGMALAPANVSNATLLTAGTAGSSAQIYYPANATTDLIATANELRNKLNDMVGSELFPVPVAYPGSLPTTKNSIVLGKGANTLNNSGQTIPGLNIPELPDVWASGTYNAKGREHYILGVINSTKSHIIIAGTTNTAINRGIYDFLGQLGCRWFFPGANWKVIPNSSSLSWITTTRLRSQSMSLFGTNNLNLTVTADETPSYKLRKMLMDFALVSASEEWDANFADYEKWEATARINLGEGYVDYTGNDASKLPDGLYIVVGHNYGGVAITGNPSTKDWGIAKWAKNHSTLWNDNMWSLVGSIRKPNTQLAVSNQSVEGGIHQIVKDFTDWYFNPSAARLPGDQAAAPLADGVNINPNDGVDGWCECVYCKLIQDQTDVGGNPYGSVTNRMVYLANQAVSMLPANKYVIHSAYANHHEPPVPGYDPSNGNPMNFKPDPRTYVMTTTAFGTDPTPTNICLGQWLLQVQNLSYYDYTDLFHSGNSYNLPGSSRASSWRYMATSSELMRSNNADVFVTEGANGWALDGLGNYILSRMLWKGSTDATALRSEFFNKCFGPAASVMMHFYSLIDKGNSPQLNTDLIGRLYKDLSDARNLLSANSPEMARIDDLTLYVRYCELWVGYFSAQKAGNTTARLQAVKDILQFAWKIRATNMIDCNALFYNITRMDAYGSNPSPFTWPVLNDQGLPTGYPNNYPWAYNVKAVSPMNGALHPYKPSGTYDHNAIVTINQNGVSANPIMLPAEPKNYTYDVVPSCATASTRGVTGICNNNRVPIFMYTNPSGNSYVLPSLTITANPNASAGPVARGTLYNPSNPLYPYYPLEGKAIPTNAPNQVVTFAASQKGGYLFDYSWLVSTISAAAGNKVSFAAMPGMPTTYHYYLNRRYFYVPKGTKYVIAHTNGIEAGVQFHNAQGTVKKFAAQTMGQAAPSSYPLSAIQNIQNGGMINVEIIIPVGSLDGSNQPTGASLDDDQIWSIRANGTNFQLTGFYFWTIPGLVALNTDELLIPKEAYANLKPATTTAPGTTGTFGTRGQVHLYVYSNGSGVLPTLTVTNGSVAGSWKLYNEKDPTTGTPLNNASTTVPANSTNYSLTASSYNTCSTATAYHYIYTDSLTTGNSTIAWPSGSRVVIAANPQEPLPYLNTANSAQLSFYVPKGVTNIQVTASSVGSSGVVFYNNAGTSVLTQPVSTTAVTINVPVASGQDGKIWTMRSNGAVPINVTDLVFRNTPGYLSVDTNQLLIPQWMANENQGLY